MDTNDRLGCTKALSTDPERADAIRMRRMMTLCLENQVAIMQGLGVMLENSSSVKGMLLYRRLRKQYEETDKLLEEDG